MHRVVLMMSCFLVVALMVPTFAVAASAGDADNNVLKKKGAMGVAEDVVDDSAPMKMEATLVRIGECAQANFTEDPAKVMAKDDHSIGTGRSDQADGHPMKFCDADSSAGMTAMTSPHSTSIGTDAAADMVHGHDHPCAATEVLRMTVGNSGESVRTAAMATAGLHDVGVMQKSSSETDVIGFAQK